MEGERGRQRDGKGDCLPYGFTLLRMMEDKKGTDFFVWLAGESEGKENTIVLRSNFISLPSLKLC